MHSQPCYRQELFCPELMFKCFFFFCIADNILAEMCNSHAELPWSDISQFA